MNKYEEVRDRYSQGFITDAQLERYLNLGAITQEQYDEIYAIKHPVVEEIPTQETETAEKVVVEEQPTK